MNSKYITLGCCSSFLLTMLGDFCSKNGLDAKTQKDYRDETTKSAFSKYHQADKNSKLGQIKNEFYKTLSNEYKCIPELGRYLLAFPNFLQSSIKFTDSRIYNYLDRKQLVIFLIINYATFYYRNNDDNFKKNFCQIIGLHATNTYKDLLKDMKISNQEISEEANWSTFEALLQKANNRCCYNNDNERFIDCLFLTDHYLYLGFKKALQDCFDFSYKDFMYLEQSLLTKIDFLSIQQENYLNTKESNQIAKNFELNENTIEVIYSLLNVDTPENCFLLSMFLSERELKEKLLENGCKYFKECFNPTLKDEAIRYFLNSYTKISQNIANDYITKLENLNDDYYTNIMIPMYKARLLIFSLTFSDIKKDKSIKNEACNIYRTVFDNYKYIIGPNLQEFLSDAIICDVYCNPKKDIFNNSQDNTDESSVTMPGKAYWEFGYALGIFPADSKKTYLLTYNTEENFWMNFPPSKFINQKKALETYYKETKNSEYELPILIETFTDEEKIKNLENFSRKDSRQQLGLRYYSNFSIRCLKTKFKNKSKISDFKLIQNYINNHLNEQDKLFICDENGANALIRSLDRYKMLTYGFSDKAIIKRAEILCDFYEKYYQKHYELIINEAPDYGFSELINSRKFSNYYENCFQNFSHTISNFYNDVITNHKNEKEDINNLKTEIKDNIILPLIKCGNKHILDEAIFLNTRKCVSALQLAIDSFDFDIVKAIIEALPDNTNLDNILISNEYVTPLQYAIRKYDYVMQYMEVLNKQKYSPLEKREIYIKKNTERGVLKCDQIYYSDHDIITKYCDTNYYEECGINLTPYRDGNILTLQQKNLIEIIKLLAKKTNPISVTTFYYLADQIDQEDGRVFNDVLDLVRILINTGHADLAGTDFEWNKSNFIPHQTLLAYCINHTTKTNQTDKSKSQKNYALLYLLLTEYPEKLKPIINQKIEGIDNDGNYRCDTDLHYFITNMIESIKVYASCPKKYKIYGQQIAARMNQFLLLFYKAGAKFDIPDHNNKTVLDYINDWIDKMPQNSIPEEILKMLNFIPSST